MAIQCPECDGIEVKKVSLAYEEGTAIKNSKNKKTNSINSNSVMDSKSSEKTRLAQRLTPPPNPAYQPPGLLMELAVSTWSRDVKSVMAAKRKAYEEDYHKQKERYEKWERSFICLTCGHIFERERIESKNDIEDSQNLDLDKKQTPPVEVISSKNAESGGAHHQDSKTRSAYEVLGVSRMSSEGVIRLMYERNAAALKERIESGDQNATHELSIAKSAHEILSDPHRRQAYDNELDNTRVPTPVSKSGKSSSQIAFWGALSLVIIGMCISYFSPRSEDHNQPTPAGHNAYFEVLCKRVDHAVERVNKAVYERRSYDEHKAAIAHLVYVLRNFGESGYSREEQMARCPAVYDAAGLFIR